MPKSITVSVLCITYNHARFIKQTLEGFLAQKTDFDFDILINDDASDDGTVDILREYNKKYPDIIKLSLQKENQFQKGKRNMIIRYLLPRARGNYLALCEGDDYWSDPHKLQKQVDFMESHPDYVLCFHPVKVVFEKGEEKDQIYPTVSDTRGFNLEKLLQSNFIQTNSVMYRKLDTYNDMNLEVMPGDWYLHLYHAQFGKIGFIDEVMSVYRRHPGGVWWDSHHNENKFIRVYGLSHLEFYREVLKLYGENKKYRDIVTDNALTMLNQIIDIKSSQGDNLAVSAISKFPDLANDLIQRDRQAIITQNHIIKSKDEEIKSLDKALKSKSEELGAILATNSYKVGKLIMYIPGWLKSKLRSLSF